MLPRIGITMTSIQRTSMSLGVQRPTETLDGAYVEATRNAGGVPFLLPNTDPDLADAHVEPLDALMLSGGADIDPARYGAEPHPETHPPDPCRDAFELAPRCGRRGSGTCPCSASAAACSSSTSPTAGP